MQKYASADIRSVACGAILSKRSSVMSYTDAELETFTYYAGFWKRWSAYMLDSLLIFAVMFIITHSIEIVFKHNQIRAVLYFIFFLIYFVLFENSRLQATLGKRMMGIKVCGYNGQLLSFWRVLIRTLAKLVLIWLPFSLLDAIYEGRKSAMDDQIMVFAPFFILFAMCAFTKYKQTLYDYIAGSVVVCQIKAKRGEYWNESEN